MKITYIELKNDLLELAKRYGTDLEFITFSDYLEMKKANKWNM